MKDRKKKKRRSGPPSQPLGFAAQPAPARTHAAQRAGPGCRCSPAHPTAPPAAAATWPHASATLQHSVVFLSHASTAYATDARQRWQGGPGGHAWGMALSLPCATPTPPHASHWMPPNTSPPLDRHPPWEHEARLQSSVLGCPSARPIARRHLVANHFTLRVEGQGRVRERRAEPLPGGGPGARRGSEHRRGSSRSERHCTALLPELHSHDSSLHRHPLALNTDSGPYAAETSS